MLPSITPDNMSDCRLAHTIHLGKEAISTYTSGVLFSDRPNLFGGQASTSMALPAGRRFGMYMLPVPQSRGRASFASRILKVLRVGSQKQMTRVDTQRRVAMMAHEHAFRDRANQQSVGQAMSADSLVMRDMEASVFTACTTSPKPTAGRASGHVNVRPEASFSELVHHDSLSTRRPPQPGGFCLGNQHVRLWGSYKENPPGASVSLDASIIAEGWE